MLNRYKEAISGIAFLIFAIAYGLESLNIKIYKSYGDIGLNSRSLPQLLTLFLIILSTLLIISGIKKAKDYQEASMVKEKMFGKKVVLTIVSIAIYIGLMNSIGFLIMTMIYLLLQILLLVPQDRKDKKTYVMVAAVSILFSVIVYFIFVKGLSLILPRGILG